MCGHSNVPEMREIMMGVPGKPGFPDGIWIAFRLGSMQSQPSLACEIHGRMDQPGLCGDGIPGVHTRGGSLDKDVMR